MGYPRTLDEISTEELTQELEFRAKAREDGKCDYCGREPATSSCRFPGRHYAQYKEPNAKGLRHHRDCLNDEPGVTICTCEPI